MRMPRFTIRRMMVGVAVVAVLVWSVIEARRLHRLSKYYRERAQSAANGEIGQQRVIADRAKTIRWCQEALPTAPPQAREAIKQVIRANERDMARRPVGIAYYVELKRKYERAARYPWLPVANDPEIPEMVIQHGWNGMWSD